MTETYTIPESRFEELKKRLEKWNSRAEKLREKKLELEFEPLTFDVVGDKMVPEFYPNPYPNAPELAGKPTGLVKKFVEVQVSGKPPVVAGYRFLARLQHTEAGNIVSRAPGCPSEHDLSLEKYREASNDCEHCGWNRKRKDTFVLEETKTGTLKQIGRTCLGDYLRTGDAAEAVRIFNLLHEIGASHVTNPVGYAGGEAVYVSTKRFIASALSAIRSYGWHPSKTDDATVSSTWFIMRPPPIGGYETWQNLQPTEEDEEKAEKILIWARSLSDDKSKVSDYLWNLRVACSFNFLVEKTSAIVASAPVAYNRAMERKARELAEKSAAATEAAEKATSGFYGDIGQRYTLTLTVMAISEFKNTGGFGPEVKQVLKFKDGDNNVFTWFPSKYVSAEIGDVYQVKATVKKHDEWRGRKQTLLTRCMLMEKVEAA